MKGGKKRLVREKAFFPSSWLGSGMKSRCNRFAPILLFIVLPMSVACTSIDRTPGDPSAVFREEEEKIVFPSGRDMTRGTDCWEMAIM